MAGNAEVPDRRGTVSILGLASIVLTHRRLMLILPLVLAVAVVVGLSLLPRRWTARASFLPQSDDQQSNLARVAAQFGFAAPASQGPGSAFYVEFLTSRSVLSEILLGRYATSDDSSRKSLLLENLRVRGATHALQVEKGLKKLRKRLSTDLSVRTGLVSFSVTLADPVLAKEVAERFLDEVNRFNVERRQSRARAQRIFAEARMADLGIALREAEDRLQAFIQRNRDYRDSPQLTFQQERLAREVTLRQETYVMMNTAFEQARIDEVRDTPVITIIEEPAVPALPEPRQRAIFALLSLIAGGFFALIIGAARTWLDQRRGAGDPELASLVVLKAQAVADLKRWLGLARSGR